MSFQLRAATATDVDFIFECLRELRGAAIYSAAELADYLHRHRLLDHPEFRILVGQDGPGPVGILTCNRFAMPRYLGFGVEIEEVVVHAQFQRRGFAKAMIEALLEQLKADATVRKVMVKTDDQLRAGRVYQSFFDVVQTTVYAHTVNRL